MMHYKIYNTMFTYMNAAFKISVFDVCPNLFRVENFGINTLSYTYWLTHA